MFKSLMKTNQILKIMNNSLITLPTPINISIWWNFGSLLGLCLMLQILSGIMISMHYCANSSMAFNSLIHIIQNVNLGWLMRLMHMNGASFFFMCLFIHIGRGIYYNSYNLIEPWMIGTIIFIMTMATAFMGYVLPWGQMSFWGATVITNLISTIPYIGTQMTEWIWGGFSVNNPTLNRFFTLHFILPFLIIALVMIHLLFIHKTGSNNPLGTNSNMYMIMFHSYFSLKDILGFLLMMFMLMMMMFLTPFLLSDPENFILASPMNTPIHIQPEWYFLFAYTILRSIPNKLGGVLALLMSILILMIMPFFSFNKTQGLKFYPINQILFWVFFNIFIILTWLGKCPVESPFIETSQIMSINYFIYYFMNPLLMKIWDKINF